MWHHQPPSNAPQGTPLFPLIFIIRPLLATGMVSAAGLRATFPLPVLSLPPTFFFFNCIEDFKIRIVSCSYPIHCQCLLLPLYPALLLIPWSLAPLLLPLFTQKLCTSQSAMLYRLGKKKKKKDCLPCLEVLYREVLDFGTTHELPSSCISPFRGQLRTASKNVQHCRHCFVRDARSKMHMPNLSLIEP